MTGGHFRVLDGRLLGCQPRLSLERATTACRESENSPNSPPRHLWLHPLTAKQHCGKLELADLGQAIPARIKPPVSALQGPLTRMWTVASM